MSLTQSFCVLQFVIGEFGGAGRINGSVGKFLALAFVRERGVGAAQRQKCQNQRHDHTMLLYNWSFEKIVKFNRHRRIRATSL